MKDPFFVLWLGVAWFAIGSILGWFSGDILSFLGCLSRRRKHRHKPTRIVFFINGKEVGKMANLRSDQNGTIKLTIVDGKGRPTGQVFDVAPTLTLSDPTLASLSPDNLTLIPSGSLGTETLSATGVVSGKTITGSVDVILTAGEAASILLEVIPV